MTKTPSKFSSNAGGGCLMLFALPFAGFGVFMLGAILRDVAFWSSTQSWVATPAVLLEVDVRTVKNAHRADARYRYEFAGKTYEGDRVAIHKGADNISSYNLDRGRELERHFLDKRSVSCFVNPEAPEQVVLYRDLRPGYLAFKSLFALVFGGVGFGLLYGGVWSIGNAKHTAQRQRQYPDEPWKWRDEWRVGRIKSNGGAAAWAVGLFAALWNAMSWPALAGMIVQGKLKFGPELFILLFPLAGLLLGGWAVYLIARRVKWGVSEFEMAAIPGVLGGPLAGIVHAPRSIYSESGYTIRLACVETVRERSGGKSQTREVTRWSRAKTIARNLAVAGDRTAIPVQFIIPYGMPSSGEDDIKWKLTVEAATEGVDYHAEFEVPVFETEASSESALADVEDASGLYAAPPEFATVVSHMRAVLEEDFPDRRAIYFPMARNRGLAVGLSLAATVCVAVTVGVYLSPASIWFAIGMGLFSLLMLSLATSAVFERSRLEFGIRGVAYQRSVIRAGELREFPPERIKDIEVDKSGTEVNGVPYWKVVLRTEDGGDHTLATEIKDRQIADRLAAEISAGVGLSKSRTRHEFLHMPLEAELPAELRAE